MKRFFVAKQVELLGVDEARARILSHFRRLEPETVEISAAGGRVLAANVVAPINVPPFANSSMDGFALRSGDVRDATPNGPVRLPITSTVAAGSTGIARIGPGECARIMTGAPLPSGADAVIPFEDVSEDGDRIAVGHPVHTGACVRIAGQDVTRGTEVLRDGTLLHAPQIGLLASLGIPSIPVTRVPVVAVLSTGDELVVPGHPLRPGEIYNSNSPMLAQAIREAGASPLVLPASGDDRSAIKSAVAAGESADLLITSGGASVGDFDYVKDVIEDSGEIAFWRVRMRPGKPLIFGRAGATSVIGLPGNPTSAMVTFEQFVRPAIRTMLGLPPGRSEIEAVLDADMENHGGRRTYARIRLRLANDGFHVAPSGPQDSAMLAPLAHADGLMEIPEDREELKEGERVRVQVWTLPEGQP